MRELKPVYEIQTCKSRVASSGVWPSEELTGKIAAAVQEVTDGYAVCWLHHAILVGRVGDGRMSFYRNPCLDYPRYLLRLRIFDREKECHVWRSGAAFRYRKRHDSNGDSDEYVEAIQPLWGTQASAIKDAPGWSRVFENRGAELFVPFDGLVMDESRRRLSIVTRNYIGSADQAGYVDCRFMKFDLPGGSQ